MMYVRWLLLLVLDILATVLSYPLAPIVVLFASDNGWLPRWLWWFQTPDNSLNGDDGWRNKHLLWRYKLPVPLGRYVGRVGWLWRNSAYGFAIDVIGAKTLGTDVLEVRGDLSVHDTLTGSTFRVLHRNGKPRYFQYYLTKKWSSNRYVRVNIGWKLWQFRAGENVNCQFVCVTNPIKSVV
jgi:hypothetical protein